MFGTIRLYNIDIPKIIFSLYGLPVCAGDHVRQRMEMEVKRMGFDTQNVWRVSDINCNFKYVTDTLP